MRSTDETKNGGIAEVLEMKVFTTPQKLAEFVGEQWRSSQASASRTAPFIVSSPLSSTPRLLYRWIVDNATTFSNWSQFRFLMMDEQFAVGSDYRYIGSTEATSFLNFARSHLIDPLSERVPLHQSDVVILPALDKLSGTDIYLREHGGIDFLVLAVGLDGHYAQAMPGTPLHTGFHVARLSQAVTTGHTHAPNSPFFGEVMSEYGMSLGPMQVIEAKAIYVLITGEQKRAVADRLLAASDFDPDFPISIVMHRQVRQRVTLCLTRDVLRTEGVL